MVDKDLQLIDFPMPSFIFIGAGVGYRIPELNFTKLGNQYTPYRLFLASVL